MKNHRTNGLLWVTTSYLLALAAAYFSGSYFHQLDYHPLWTVLIADAVGTLVIFIFSFLFNNSSFYDPYWSVAPIAIAAWWMILGWADTPNQPRSVLAFALVAFWGLRLTWNWMRGWTGLDHEDWRYVAYRKKGKLAYWLISFSGFHFFPTLLVFLGLMPLYAVMIDSQQPFGLADMLAALFTFSAISIELIADNQLFKYKKLTDKPSNTLTSGLWAYSRHPNYLGEIAFWWGLFLLGMAANRDYWWTGIGALSITLLFVFISIPMIDKRMLEKRPNYKNIMEKIPGILPFKILRNKPKT